MRRILLVIALVFFLVGCFDLKYSKAQDSVTIVITEYGVNPPEAPIKKIGKLYIFTGDIYGRIDIFQATNIILEGAGYTLKGNGAWSGILIVDENGVTILNNVLCNNKYDMELNLKALRVLSYPEIL